MNQLLGPGATPWVVGLTLTAFALFLVAIRSGRWPVWVLGLLATLAALAAAFTHRARDGAGAGGEVPAVAAVAAPASGYHWDEPSKQTERMPQLNEHRGT